MVKKSVQWGGKALAADQVQLLHELRGLTVEAIEKLPEGAFRRSVGRLEYPDLPRARLTFHDLQSGGTGARPPQPVLAALNELQSLRQQVGGLKTAGIPTGPISTPDMLGIVLPDL